MDATERVRQLEEQLQYYQQQQSAITDGANAVLQQALQVSPATTINHLPRTPFQQIVPPQGAHQPLESSESLDNVQQQVQLLSLLASTRAYGEVHCRAWPWRPAHCATVLDVGFFIGAALV